MRLCYNIEICYIMAKICKFFSPYSCYDWMNIDVSSIFYEYEFPRGAICLPIFFSSFSAAGLSSRRFTTVPCANTPSLPSEVRLFGADTGWEKRSNKRKEYISGSFFTWTVSEHRASPPVQTIWPENSMWKLGWRKKGPRWGRQLAELPNRARWSSLVASQATL